MKTKKNKLELGLTKEQLRKFAKLNYEKGQQDFQDKYCPNCIYRKNKKTEELIVA